MSGGVALEASADVGVGLLLGPAAGQVALGGLVAVDHAPVDDGVQGSVEATVTEAVEAMTGDAARGRRYGADTGESGERGLGSAAAVMRPGDDEVRGTDRADARFGQQSRHQTGNELVELAVVGPDLLVQLANLLRQGSQGLPQGPLR